MNKIRDLMSMDEILKILETDKRYKLAAYEFILAAVKFAHDTLELGEPISQISRLDDGSFCIDDDEPPGDASRDISAADICKAIKIYAIDKFGLLAKPTLNNWGIKSTADFGQIIFNLIKCEALLQSDRDNIDDYNNVFDFDTAFEKQFSFLFL